MARHFEGEAKTARERAGDEAHEHNPGQTIKAKEQRPEPDEKPRRKVEHEAIRSMQTPNWDYGVSQEYAPTSHTSNRMKKQVLNVMPDVGAEFDHATDAVSGAKVVVKSEETCIPVRKAEWEYDQPRHGLIDDEIKGKYAKAKIPTPKVIETHRS